MDLYAVLGVERGASADEIRRAYRQAALLWHPDRNPDPEAADVFHAVQEAYEWLREPARRQTYDLTLAAAFGPRKLRFADGERPDWVPPEDQQEPLRFVVGQGWRSWEDGFSEPQTAAATTQTRAQDGAAGRRRWTRDERLGLGVAVFAAVVGAVAIAIAPMFS